MSISIQKVECLEGLKHLESNLIDIIITSPPYNLDIKYNTYKDKMKRDVYLNLLYKVFKEIKRTMKDNASFFLNIGASNKDPWIPYDVANEARKLFKLQNNIIWTKSIDIDGKTYGHFKPINSKRFTNHTFEHIFHFTKDGNVIIDRLSIGVPYTDESNIKRWKTKSNIRCRGNMWYIPYKTIKSRSQKNDHPAIFPEELAEMCIKLHGFDKNMIVCDPFVGTGTTMVAAKKMGVSGIGMDIDEEYIKYAKERLLKLEMMI